MILPLSLEFFSSAGKESAYNAGNPCSIPGLGRFPEEEHGYPLQDSCLENPHGRGAWQAAVHGVTKSWTWLGNLAHTHGLKKGVWLPRWQTVTLVLCPFSYSRTTFARIPFPAWFQIGVSHKRNCPETGKVEVKLHFILWKPVLGTRHRGSSRALSLTAGSLAGWSGI